jgi:hypothetical protein
VYQGINRQSHGELRGVNTRKLSNHTMNSTMKFPNTSSNISLRGNLFKQALTPQKSKVFAYKESPFKPSDEYQRNRNSRLVDSYQVPLKNQQNQYIEVMDKNTNVRLSFKFVRCYQRDC